jgi:hypothetical protein
VYGADGKLIEVYENVIQFNLSEYPAGLYFIRNEEGATQRLLLN